MDMHPGGGCNANENMAPRSAMISLRKGYIWSRILGSRIRKKEIFFFWKKPKSLKCYWTRDPPLTGGYLWKFPVIRGLFTNWKVREKGILLNGMDEGGIPFTTALHPPGYAFAVWNNQTGCPKKLCPICVAAAEGLYALMSGSWSIFIRQWQAFAQSLTPCYNQSDKWLLI